MGIAQIVQEYLADGEPQDGDRGCLQLGDGYECVAGRCRQRVTADGGLVPSAIRAQVSGHDAGSSLPVHDSGDRALNNTLNIGCERKTPPRAPSNVQASGVDHEIVVAQRTADFGDAASTNSGPATRYQSIGFDLDGQCTSAGGNEGSCVHLPPSNAVMDGPFGVDNAFGQLVQTMRDGPRQWTSPTDAEVETRSNMLVFHLTGYNGTADDSDVTVEVAWGMPSRIGGPPPSWNGNDVFVYDPNHGGNSASGSTGYVSSGKLVASVATLSVPVWLRAIPITMLQFDFTLLTGTLVCDVAPVDIGTWGYGLSNCTIAGTFLADDLLHQTWHQPDPVDPTNGTPLCTSSASYPAFKKALCSLADMPNMPPSMASSPGSTPGFGALICTALSFGMNFDTSPVILGGLVDITAGDKSNCPRATDPTYDSCAIPSSAGSDSGTK